MKVELRNVRIDASKCRGATCYTASVFINGKFAAMASNEGWGEPDEYKWVDTATEKAFKAFCYQQPPVKVFGSIMAMDAELYIGQLLQQHENRLLCRNKTVYRLHLPAGNRDWFVMDCKYGPAIKSHLRRMHGDNLAEVMNETLSV